MLTYFAFFSDIEDPIFQCPDVDEKFAVTGELQIEVFWSEPSYKDNSGLLGGMNFTHNSPTVFGIGVHNVTYFAWDPSSNTAQCSIVITVTGML